MPRPQTRTVTEIQLVMSEANPIAWQDAIVLNAQAAVVTLRLLSGTTVEVRVVGASVDLATGDPVAYHPVAEILAAGDLWVTARR